MGFYGTLLDQPILCQPILHSRAQVKNAAAPGGVHADAFALSRSFDFRALSEAGFYGYELCQNLFYICYSPVFNPEFCYADKLPYDC
jgi:hypothetical protein